MKILIEQTQKIQFALREVKRFSCFPQTLHYHVKAAELQKNSMSRFSLQPHIKLCF